MDEGHLWSALHLDKASGRWIKSTHDYERTIFWTDRHGQFLEKHAEERENLVIVAITLFVASLGFAACGPLAALVPLVRLASSLCACWTLIWTAFVSSRLQALVFVAMLDFSPHRRDEYGRRDG